MFWYEREWNLKYSCSLINMLFFLGPWSSMYISCPAPVPPYMCIAVKYQIGIMTSSNLGHDNDVIVFIITAVEV